MANKPAHYHDVLSLPRLTTLFASVLVTLGSGTNYVYSAYAPQLGARLQISHTQLNIVGSAGNVGVYSSGPVWGRIVDTRGPRILLASAFLLLLTGYSGIRYIFDSGISPSSTTISMFTFGVLMVCSFLTGAGGNGGLTSAVNSTAKTFPDRARSTATGIVLSGFGLSAFLFSTIARAEFSGNTSSFILLLALGTSIPMIVGFFLIRPIPLPPTEHERERSSRDEELAGTEAHASEGRALLASHDDLPETPVQLSRGASLKQGIPPNVYGHKLWTSSDFWLLFLILSMLSGTGLMYINNVGSMSQALYAKSAPVFDPREAALWQAKQVSTVSLLNCFGRIFIGFICDYAKNRFGLPRSYSLVLVSSFFLISQITAANINDINHLWISSAMLGLSHGSVFSLFPNVCLDWFGMPHFSENWGYLAASPILAGNLFSIAFGRVLDSHSDSPIEKVVSQTTTTTTQCMLGKECYVEALHLTTVACFLSILLSFWAGWRDRQKLAASLEMTAGRRNETWEHTEER